MNVYTFATGWNSYETYSCVWQHFLIQLICLVTDLSKGKPSSALISRLTVHYKLALDANRSIECSNEKSHVNDSRIGSLKVAAHIVSITRSNEPNSGISLTKFPIAWTTISRLSLSLGNCESKCTKCSTKNVSQMIYSHVSRSLRYDKFVKTAMH